MGKVLLSGGGDKEQTEIIDQYFVKQINPNKPLLYIPIALKGVIPFENCYEWITSVFKPIGIENITMWTDLDKKSIHDLNKFSAVYIGGGNTFSLLNDLRTSEFDKVLTAYIANEGVIYGGSAGAIVLGANIMTSAHMDPNNIDFQNFDGLGLIGDYSLWCHYHVKNDHLINDYIKDYKKPVIALAEETGVCFDNKSLIVIGNAPAYVFEDQSKREIKPGNLIREFSK
ncbi:Type 1 glutamine amidotransferase-like domain-containing protein [Virgibacillus sp. DJP39]|uniref:Type 1 glutamine amidotransferase-like domain-containing protein n=1 Tax=Virgibacillus sp. DJP39 TaxID=3409790 RepID=UPI003BB6AFC7